MGVTISRFHPDLRGDLQQFIRSVAKHDDQSMLSEYKELRLDGHLDAREQVALGPNGELVGYGQAAWHHAVAGESGHWAVEIVVHPNARDSSVAADLIESIRAELGDAAVTLWARAGYVADAARATGWYRDRELLEMWRSLPIECSNAGFEGFTVATFRVGVDESDWLRANNAAFAGHPENGSITRRDLEHRIARAWFDPNGFFIAWEGGDLVGSCWTKIHENGVGEIYIVGVVPGWEGRGLGRALVCQGLEYLAKARHVNRAKLYVEARNTRATGLYETLGFETRRVIEAFQRAW